MSEWGDMRPAYLRIAEAVRARIDSGEIPPGEPIPSVNALMAEFNVAGTTVQKAVRTLRAAGLVETRPGRGVYVRERQQLISRSASYIAPAADGEKAPYEARTKLLEVAEAVPPEDIAEALDLDVEEAAVVRRRLMLLNGEDPVELTDSWYPLSIARGTGLASTRQLKGGSPAELHRLGYEPHHCAERVTARMPTAEEAHTLNLAAGVPVLRILRTVFTEADQRIEVTSMVMAADRYQLLYELPVH